MKWRVLNFEFYINGANFAFSHFINYPIAASKFRMKKIQINV